MTPLGWKYALLVWGYALAWFFINDMVKVEVYRMMHLGTASHQRHLARVNANLHPAAQGKTAPATKDSVIFETQQLRKGSGCN